MTNDEKLMQQALDALLRVWRMDRTFKDEQTIEALRARLAQPEPEPVAILRLSANAWDGELLVSKSSALPFGTKLYTAPPQREWQGLTEVERMDILDTELTTQSTEHFALAQAIEAKLKAKNAT